MRIKESTNLLTGILFTLFLGSLSHFFYQWTNENLVVGLFSPVNESVWEHTKMLFFPVFFYTFFEMTAHAKMDGHFLTARLVALVTGVLLIPSLFFIYTGFLGIICLPLDIAIFVVCTIVTFLLTRYLEIHADALYLPPFVLFILVLFCLILFFSFTYSPPELPIFQPVKQIN